MIYVDNAATTPMYQSVLDAMIPYMSGPIFGNPSSTHFAGVKAYDAVKKSAEKISKILNCHPTDLVFTSGGTESDNLAIKGLENYLRSSGKTEIITSAIEHDAVLQTCKYMESRGFKVTYIRPDSSGIVSPDDIEKELTTRTGLVSVMYVNNEIGTIEPIEDIGNLCRKHQVLFHTDAVQAAGKLDLDVNKLNVDLMSISAHKFHGPKGIGLLYTKHEVPLDPIIHGGGQQTNRRSGTENVPGIVGMAEALESSYRKIGSDVGYLSKMLVQGLSGIKGVSFNSGEQGIPHIVNCSIDGIHGESLLYYLSAYGVCASTGSACSSKSLNPSHVLTAIGRSAEESMNSIRISIDDTNTEHEISIIVQIISKYVDKYR